MRTVRIDFSNENVLPDGEYIGRMGEHNATDLEITPPAEMAECEEIINYVAAFVTEGKIIRSDFYPKAEKISVPLCAQLTQDHTLSVQLEGYDGNGSLLVKSAVLTGLKLLPSAGGDETDFDGESGGMVTQINLNTLARHNHSNKEVLDKLGEDGGLLTFNGKQVGTSSPETVVLNVKSGEAVTEFNGNTVYIYMYEGENRVPEGSRILSIEYNLVSQGENEWRSLEDSIETNVYSPYFINMNRAFAVDGLVYLALMTFFTSSMDNDFCMAAASYGVSKLRVTFTNSANE